MSMLPIVYCLENRHKSPYIFGQDAVFPTHTEFLIQTADCI